MKLDSKLFGSSHKNKPGLLIQSTVRWKCNSLFLNGRIDVYLLQVSFGNRFHFNNRFNNDFQEQFNSLGFDTFSPAAQA